MTFLGLAVIRIALVRRAVILSALVLAVIPFVTSQAPAQDDVGLPMHPQTIPSTIVRQSGEGEGTQWIKVHFKINAPYRHVVRFYQEKVGRNAHISQADAGKLLNTLILVSKDPADQLNVNISSEVGGKVTQVELSRNMVRP
ncbi:MAG: hypothetical protein K8F29_06350 [Kofleriaceae bacterium]|nr:hypothetical protein [Candidatus Methylomirabilis lanthanidiphila]